MGVSGAELEGTYWSGSVPTWLLTQIMVSRSSLTLSI